MQLKINLNVVPASTNDNKFYEDTFSTNENLISVRRLERGMDGSPLFFFLLRSEREILNMGKSFVIIYVIFFILSALITSFLGYYFVKKDCLDRIRYLVAQLTDIRSSKSEKTQVEVSGDDELNKLVEGINNTLDTLQSERGKAETANKVKSEFIANISHEIRTPLNSILGMVELLGETRLDKDQSEYVEIVNSAGKNLLSVINDVLEISKIEAGHLKIEKIEFLLGEMVGRVVSLYSLEAAGKNLSLTCNIPENIPERVSGDPTRLRQVLVNLISNAIKFTSDGGVEVSLRLDESCCPPKIFFSVSDSGIGIASDKLDDVFASFYQADSSTSRKYGGTGLGLSISHKLITMMGGQITVDSCLGRGTRFTFYVSLGIS